MFEIRRDDDGNIMLTGKLDASQADKARVFFDTITESCTLDFQDLVYISSAGLGILIGAQRRLSESDHKLKVKNLNNHISELFKVAGFDKIFDIE